MGALLKHALVLVLLLPVAAVSLWEISRGISPARKLARPSRLWSLKIRLALTTKNTTRLVRMVKANTSSSELHKIVPFGMLDG
jgi:hypothetical protein